MFSDVDLQHIATCAGLPDERTIKMAIFFQSIGTLMSLLLRRIVENSLADLVSVFSDFAAGNAYDGSYDLLGPLGLPLLPHPIRIFLVRCEQNAVV